MQPGCVSPTYILAEVLFQNVVLARVVCLKTFLTLLQKQYPFLGLWPSLVTLQAECSQILCLATSWCQGLSTGSGCLSQPAALCRPRKRDVRPQEPNRSGPPSSPACIKDVTLGSSHLQGSAHTKSLGHMCFGVASSRGEPPDSSVTQHVAWCLCGRHCLRCRILRKHKQL